MDPVLAYLLAALGLGASMLLLMEAGRRFGLRRLAVDPTDTSSGIGAVNAAVFSLLGLLLAFGYSDASKRLDERRRLVVEEVNDIGTAWLRIALLPPAAQPAIRKVFLHYVDVRIEYYAAPDAVAATSEAQDRVERAQNDLWDQSVAACSQTDGDHARMLLLPALNAMIDIMTTRLSMRLMHPPGLVFVVFVMLSLASAFLAGLGMAVVKARSWIHMIAFPVMISGTLYLVADIEYPRSGLVRAQELHQMLIEFRQRLH